jgi:hypothetical protein
MLLIESRRRLQLQLKPNSNTSAFGSVSLPETRLASQETSKMGRRVLFVEAANTLI